MRLFLKADLVPRNGPLSSKGLLQANVRYARAVFDHFDAPMISLMPADAYVSLLQCELCKGMEPFLERS